MNHTNTNHYIISISIVFGSFFNKSTTAATIENGRLMIDSIPSIFVISPDLLVDGDTIQLYQSANRTLEGTVARTGFPPTAIGDYRITSKMVTAYHKTDSGKMAMPLTLGFDLKTGIITEAAGQLTDILLDKMSIDFILGGTFELISYSQNLPFELVGQFPTWVIFIAVGAVIFCVITTLAYRNSPKRKHTQKAIKNNVGKMRLVTRY